MEPSKPKLNGHLAVYFSRDLGIRWRICSLVPRSIRIKAGAHLIHVWLDYGWGMLGGCLPAGPTKQDSKIQICSNQQGNEDLTKVVHVPAGGWQRWQRPQGPSLLVPLAQKARASRANEVLIPYLELRIPQSLLLPAPLSFVSVSIPRGC